MSEIRFGNYRVVEALGSGALSTIYKAVQEPLGRIAPGKPVHVLALVDGPEDELVLESPADLRVTWVHGHDVDDLLQAVEKLAFPHGELQAFVHGEAGLVRRVRRHLVHDRGVRNEVLSASGYWKRRRTEEGWREDKAEWNRQVEADVVPTSRA